MPVNPAMISLRPERPEDEPFLRKVYGSTRQEELEACGLPAELREAFLNMQFKAQQQGYRNSYPHAEFLVILLANQPVGRMAVNSAAGELRLIDIALLPEHRNLGIGTALIRKLSTKAAAAGLPLRLSVLKDLRAVHLYHRLGFAKTGESGWRELMEWRAGKPPAPTAPDAGLPIADKAGQAIGG